MRTYKTKAIENILILGLGGVGFYLAKRLAHEGYAVTVIEQDNYNIRQADGTIDARILKGNECHEPRLLERSERQENRLSHRRHRQ